DNTRPNPLALRYSARPRPGRTSRPPWYRLAEANAPRRTRVANPRSHRLTSSPRRKCSDDFSSKLLICLCSAPDSAQAWLGRAPWWQLPGSRASHRGEHDSGPVRLGDMSQHFCRSVNLQDFGLALLEARIASLQIVAHFVRLDRLTIQYRVDRTGGQFRQ